MAPTPRFGSVPEVREGLRTVDYLADEGIAGVVYLADRLGKPVLTANQVSVWEGLRIAGDRTLRTGLGTLFRTEAA